MQLEQNIKNLIQQYKNNEIYQSKIRDIYIFLSTEYKEWQLKLESNFKKAANSHFTNYSQYFVDICSFIMDGKIEKNISEDGTETTIKGFENLTFKDEEIINEFIILLYEFLSKKYTFNKMKLYIFLQCHDINYNDFLNINKISMFALCEMKENGIDISTLKDVGNYQIEFANKVSKGLYTNQNVKMAIINGIMQTIDYVFKTGEMHLMEVDKDISLLFDLGQNKKLQTIRITSDIDEPVVIVNDDNEFIKGNIDNILDLYNIRELNTKQSSTTTLDEYIDTYSNKNIDTDDFLKKLCQQILEKQQNQ